MDWVPLNWALLKQPLNYFIVGTVLLVTGIFVCDVVLPLFQQGSSDQ